MKVIASTDDIVTGDWSKTSQKESAKIGTARVAATTEANGFNSLPAAGDIHVDPKAAYLHFTANETIHGAEWTGEPAVPAGVTVMIIRNDMLERVPANLPVMLDNKTLAENELLHNTPPCYSIYLAGLVFK